MDTSVMYCEECGKMVWPCDGAKVIDDRLLCKECVEAENTKEDK